MSKTGVAVELVGQDGNAFAIMGRVTRAMRKAGVDREVIEQYRAEAMSGDYDNLLAVTMEFVDEVGVEGDDGPCVCGSYDHPTEDHPTDEPGEYLEPDEAPEVTQ